jgi:hypothetical protein
VPVRHPQLREELGELAIRPLFSLDAGHVSLVPGGSRCEPRHNPLADALMFPA